MRTRTAGVGAVQWVGTFYQDDASIQALPMWQL